MNTESTIKLLKKLPSWEIGRAQETSFLSEGDLSKHLSELREIAFEMDGNSLGIDHEESIDSLRVLALRNLARAGQREDVDELLDLIRILDYEDPDFGDAVIADFDWLMVRFGEVAIEPLSELASNLGLGEEGRIYVVIALTALAVAGHRSTEIWNLFRDLLGKGAAHRAVSGWLLVGLAQNQAATADFLFAIHDENRVDVTVCGDREQLEIMLKLREKRETKAPNLAELEEQSCALFYRGQLGNLPADASPEAVIEYFLILYQRPSCAKDSEMVHGLLSALIVSPEMAPPSAIMGIIWDTCGADPKKMPGWEGMEELQRFSAAVMEFYNEMVTKFGEGHYLPSLSEVEYEDEDEDEEMEGPVYSLDSWSDGLFAAAEYLKEIQGSNDFTEELAEVAEELVIEVLKSPVMNEGEIEISSFNMIRFLEMARETQQGAPSMPPASPIMGMPSPYDLASAEPVIRDEPKTGRNDPCPCGSGKKFKKCCAN